MPDRGTNHRAGVAYGDLAYVSLTAAQTLLPARDWNGKTVGLNLAGGFTVTLPSVALAGAGWRIRFRVETAPTTAYIITEDTANDTNVITTSILEAETDTGDDGPYNAAHTTITFAASVAVVGDYIDIECNGSRFFAVGRTNADGGVTLA